ncbi:hypothetical protein INT47_002997 [Mucor saturninus]|uniref:Uncharacterized protein n=1 Tax=Mucor saturninus TaxID=64648 RepID=A0A8H7QUF3_9FUNG|nr:hypothetical protein INT47_002997 [Mucor saturninus]
MRLNLMNTAFATATLECRFYPVAHLGLIKMNFMLHSMRMHSSEQLVQFMDRFGAYVHAAKIQPNNNFFFTICFLSSLFTKDFQDKVQEHMVDYMKKQNFGSTSTMFSKYATYSEVQFYEFYSNFNRVAEAINSNLGPLENIVKEIQSKYAGSKASSSSYSASDSTSGSSSGSSTRDSQKKRKFDDKGKGKDKDPNNFNFENLYNPSYKLNDQERMCLHKKNQCLSCRVTKFSVQHMNECAERKKFLANNIELFDETLIITTKFFLHAALTHR